MRENNEKEGENLECPSYDNRYDNLLAILWGGEEEGDLRKT